MPLIRLLARAKIQAAVYAEGQVVLFPKDVADAVLSSKYGEEVQEAPVFVNHVSRIEPDPEPSTENLPEPSSE